MSEPAVQPAAPAVVPAAPAPQPDGVETFPSDADVIATYHRTHPPATQAPPGGEGTPPVAPPVTPPVAGVPVAPAASAAATVAAVPGIDERIAEYVRQQAKDTIGTLETKREAEGLRTKMAALEAEHAALRARLRDDPLAAVQSEGWDFEALARKAVGQDKPEMVEIRRMKDEVAKLRAEAEARDRAAAEAAQSAQAEANIRNWRSGIMPALEAKREDFKHTLAFMEPGEIQDAVQSVVQRVYQGSGGTRVLSIEEAASLLETQAKQRLERIRPLVTTAASPPAGSPVAPSNQTPVSRGLTNQVTQGAPLDDPDDLSDAALTARARRFYEARVRAS